MPASVATADELAALAARVAKLEAVVPTPPIPPTPPATGIRILPEWVANAEAAALANSPAWKKFQADLDANLPLVVTAGQYQASSIPWGMDYACGYRGALKRGDTVRADQYAKKAAGLLKCAIRDNQKGGWCSFQLLGVSDGVRTRWQLPDAGIVTNLETHLADANVGPVVKTTKDYEEITYYAKWIRISDNQDGTSPYTEGADWSHGGDYPNNRVTWLSGGRRPAKGATYWLQWADLTSAQQHLTYTVDKTTDPWTMVTATPLAKGRAVFVDYVKSDYSQTGANDGGWNSMLVDDSYPSRSLGRISAILDWCNGHAAVESLRVEASAMLVRWCDYLKASGYGYANIQSNYSCGHWMTRAWAAVLLAGSTDGNRLMGEVLDFRTKNMIPQLSGPAPSLVGGSWGEGWNYGAGSVFNIVLGSEALRQAGKIDAAVEREFVNQVCLDLVHTSSLWPVSGIDFGDGYKYPASTVDAYSRSLYAAFADPAKGGLLSGPAPSISFTCVAQPPQPPAVAHEKLDTVHFANGTGLVAGRINWIDPAIWFASMAGNLLGCDHQQYSVGHTVYARGSDQLLISGTAVSQQQQPNGKSQESNVLVCDDGGTGLQTYRHNQGLWYGVPGIVNLKRESTIDFIHVADDCKASYSKASSPGDGGPLSLWVRHRLFLRATGTLIVCDHYALKNAACTALVRWHLSPGSLPTVNATGFYRDSGTSKLFGQVLSADPIMLAVAFSTAQNSGTVPRIDAKTGSLSGTIISVFQAGASGAAFVPAVLNADGSVTVAGKTMAFKPDGTANVV